MTTRADRIKGVLAASAGADALGSPYEYQTPPKGPAVFGARGTYGHPAGSFTDDTEQAIIVAKARSDVSKVADGLINWWKSGPTDAGGRTSTVLNYVNTPGELAEKSRKVAEGWRSPVSNGSLMRTGPVALPYLGDRTKIYAAAVSISDLTHFDPDAREACALWSLVINDAIEQGGEFDLEFALLAAVQLLPESRQELWTTRIFQAQRQLPRSFAANGQAVRAFQAALSINFRATSIEEGAQMAVACGGDTDTVGAIAGALLGARFGASTIPQSWRDAVRGQDGETLDDIEALALEAAGEKVIA